MEPIGCVRAKMFVGNSVPRNSALLYRKRTSFSSFCKHSGSQMLRNNPKHHLGSNGGYWVCSCNHIRRNFSTPKHCITVLKLTSFSLFFMHSGSKMLLNTPKHHFRSIGGYWV